MAHITNPLTFILDIDDTIMPNAHFYWIARVRAFEELLHQFPRQIKYDDLAPFFDLIEKCSNDLFPKLKLSMERFPQALANAAQDYVYSKGITSQLPTRQMYRFKSIGYKIFDESNFGDFLPGAKETIDFLRSHNQRLIFFTEGDEIAQERKIRALNLREYGSVKIVEAKYPNTYAVLAAQFSFNPATAYMVGNSLASDIIPASNAGFGTIYIPFDARVKNSASSKSQPTGHRHHTLDNIAQIQNLYTGGKLL